MGFLEIGFLTSQMVRLARHNGLYKAVDKLWKLGVNVAGSCAQHRQAFGHKKSHSVEWL
jgi:hypothetical protein